MPLESYTLDTLRALVRALEKENRNLKALLDKAEIPYDRSSPFVEKYQNSPDYEPDQGIRILPYAVDNHLASRFFAMFWGRQDVFARRAKNGNYYPQCANRWKDAVCPRQRNQKQFCEDCSSCSWIPLSAEIVADHLRGSRWDGTDVVGVYPLLPDGTCRFLVFDFDNHEKGAEQTDFANADDSWQEEVDALRKICEQNEIEALVERSRSGKGAHVWIFFQKPMSAAKARQLGFLLLDKGAASINLKSFHSYDRMYPSQDMARTLGNLVALPLQGQAVKMGNSAFVDANWNVYPDQWQRLFQTKKLSEEQADQLISRWQAELFGSEQMAAGTQKLTRLRPWKRQADFYKEDVTGKLHMVLADGLYIDGLNLKPRIQNQIRCMATMDNPAYYKNLHMGYSNYYNFSTIYLGKDEEGYIRIPRGLQEQVEEHCRKAGISFDVEDQREKGRPIRVSFQGKLKEKQELAARRLLSFDNGVLSAATAFGKTVVCSYLIAQRKVSTLILLESSNLVEQWEEELNRFLNIDEEPPEYETKTGRRKRRSSVIGTLYAGKDTTTGIIDIAMVGSLYKKGAFHRRLRSYGMVIMDECHHAASPTAQKILEKVNARFVYGVSATPIRSDNLEKINFMLLGPVRHQYTALERAEEQGIDHLVCPRYTRVTDLAGRSGDINAAYELVSASPSRNEQICQDLEACIRQGRTPVVLTRYREHARMLYEKAEHMADYVFLLYGENSAKENARIRQQMREIPREKSMILVATGQKIGEGFDCPRLDTLMLASPVSFAGRLEQYAGRLNRDYEGKKDVIIYDYIDFHIPVFDRMYQKRLRTYRKIGFRIFSEAEGEKQEARAIYDAGNYQEIFEQDIAEARKEIVISSPELVSEKVDRLVFLVKDRQEMGVSVTVITEHPDNDRYGNTEFLWGLIRQMQMEGIQVKTTEECTEHFAVMDGELVWHGGMNLLGKADVWDNLIRVKSAKAAGELMESAEQAIAIPTADQAAGLRL